MLLCPICHRPLDQATDPAVAICGSGHCFNRAKEGYLNLLRSSKAGDTMGDPKAAARSRRDFLNKGYYAPLRDALVSIVADKVTELGGGNHALLDICCGEGYYTSALGRIDGVDAYGFDLSKEMVRLAAKRGGGTYFVANMKSVPVPDGSFSLATCLFAPFHEDEVVRVLRPGGTLYAVVPGARHLFGLQRGALRHALPQRRGAPPHRRIAARERSEGRGLGGAGVARRHRGGVPDDALLLPHTGAGPCPAR